MSFRPQESNYFIFLERTYLASAIVASAGYGIQFALFCYCAKALWRKKARNRTPQLRLLLITILFILDTIYVACSARELELAYIDYRNFPGGPLQYFLDNPTIPVNTIAVAVFFLANVMADAFLLWRCKVIWSAFNENAIKLYAALMFPFLLFLASFVTGILWTIQDTSPGSTLYSETTINLGLPYLTLSLSLNVLLTLMIIFRVLLHRKEMRSLFGTSHGGTYMFIVELTVESAALYSMFSIPLLVTYGINNPINQIFLGILTPAQLIATYLIIYREAKGYAWNKETLSVSSLVCVSQSAPAKHDIARIFSPRACSEVEIASQDIEQCITESIATNSFVISDSSTHV